MVFYVTPEPSAPETKPGHGNSTIKLITINFALAAVLAGCSPAPYWTKGQ